MRSRRTRRANNSSGTAVGTATAQYGTITSRKAVPGLCSQWKANPGGRSGAEKNPRVG
jgi:hypothetical protein